MTEVIGSRKMTNETPPFDKGNKLLGELPAELTTDVMDTPGGQRLLLTIRTPTTTLTVFLRGTDAKKWAHQLSSEAAVMSDSGLIAANGSITNSPKEGST